MEGDDVPHLINADGRKLFCKYWYPKLADDQKPRALVFVSHGAGEHCQKYNDLAAVLTAKGLLVFSHDHVGHGLSEGDRVHLDNKNTYSDDVIQHVNLIKSKYSDVAMVFIVGHSMGGLVAMKAALDNPTLFAGVALIGPALALDPTLASPFLIWFARRLANWLPQMQLKAVTTEHICRDKNVVKSYEDDPLVWHKGLKARWGMCFMELISDVNARSHEVTFPLLIIHGSADRICSPEGSQRLYDNACSANKVLKMYPGAYHQVHNEPDGVGEACIADVVNWIVDIIDK